MLIDQDELRPHLRCPRKGEVLADRGDLLLSSSGREYRRVGGQPVLIDFENSILDEKHILFSDAQSPLRRQQSALRTRLIKYALHGGADQRSGANAERFVQEAVQETGQETGQEADRPLILVIGGGSRGIGSDILYTSEAVRLVSFDIYASRQTQLVADAHRIPLEDGIFDGVWIQYVLEHVLDPGVVVSEIGRVLKSSGVVYSETPFLQQVHEAGYDFTRFTHSGHRWLFRDFSEIDSGVAMGQGPQWLWTIEHAARGLFRSRKAGQLVKMLLFWVQYLEKLIPMRYRYDSASSFYFLGKKSAHAMKPGEIVAYYRGGLDIIA